MTAVEALLDVIFEQQIAFGSPDWALLQLVGERLGAADLKAAVEQDARFAGPAPTEDARFLDDMPVEVTVNFVRFGEEEGALIEEQLTLDLQQGEQEVVLFFDGPAQLLVFLDEHGLTPRYSPAALQIMRGWQAALGVDLTPPEPASTAVLN